MNRRGFLGRLLGGLTAMVHRPVPAAPVAPPTYTYIIESVPVVAHARKLKCTWIVEMEQALEMYPIYPDFVEISRKEIEERDNDVRGIMLNYQPIAPRFLKYRGTPIFGGDGWWTLSDGERFSSLLEVLNHIDKI